MVLEGDSGERFNGVFAFVSRCDEQELAADLERKQQAPGVAAAEFAAGPEDGDGDRDDRVEEAPAVEAATRDDSDEGIREDGTRVAGTGEDVTEEPREDAPVPQHEASRSSSSSSSSSSSGKAAPLPSRTPDGVYGRHGLEIWDVTEE